MFIVLDFFSLYHHKLYIQLFICFLFSIKMHPIIETDNIHITFHHKILQT